MKGRAPIALTRAFNKFLNAPLSIVTFSLDIVTLSCQNFFYPSSATAAELDDVLVGLPCLPLRFEWKWMWVLQPMAGMLSSTFGMARV